MPNDHPFGDPHLVFNGAAAAPTMEVAGFDGGYLEGVRQGRDLIISRVISTDPAVYLKPEFAPGSTYTLPQSDNNPSC